MYLLNQRMVHLSSTSLFYSGLLFIGKCPLTLGKVICFALFSSSTQMLFSSRNTLIDSLRNYVLSAISTSLSPFRLTHKIDYHIPTSCQFNIHLHFLKLYLKREALVAQTVKNPPAMQETGVQSLGWGDPLEKGMATHSSILAWEIPWTEKPGGLQSMGSQKSQT